MRKRIVKDKSLSEYTTKGKKASIQSIKDARREALELAYQKGYITKEDVDKGMAIPTRFQKKKTTSGKKKKVIIYYGYNTISK